MKRLLVLMLVLGMASVASATYTAVDEIETEVTWKVVNDQVVGYGTTLGTYNASFGEGGGKLTPDSSFTPAGLPGSKYAGDPGSIVYNATYSSWAVYADNLPSGTQTINQNWFVFDITTWVNSGDGYMYCEIYNVDNNYTEAVGTLAITPESMTIALLGLGGLFLRRRK